MQDLARLLLVARVLDLALPCGQRRHGVEHQLRPERAGLVAGDQHVATEQCDEPGNPGCEQPPRAVLVVGDAQRVEIDDRSSATPRKVLRPAVHHRVRPRCSTVPWRQRRAVLVALTAPGLHLDPEHPRPIPVQDRFPLRVTRGHQIGRRFQVHRRRARGPGSLEAQVARRSLHRNAGRGRARIAGEPTHLEDVREVGAHPDREAHPHRVERPAAQRERLHHPAGRDAAQPLALHRRVRPTIPKRGVAAEPGDRGAHQPRSQMPQRFGVHRHLQPGQMARVVGDQAQRTGGDVAALVRDHEGQPGDGGDGPGPGEHALRRPVVPLRSGADGHVGACAGERTAGIAPRRARTGRTGATGELKIIGATAAGASRSGSGAIMAASIGS